MKVRGSYPMPTNRTLPEMFTPGNPPKGEPMKIVAVLALLALCIGFYFLGYRDGKYFGYWEGKMKQKCINLGIIEDDDLEKK